MKKLKVIWSNPAKTDLKEIYNFYKDKKLSPQTANNIRKDILQASAAIIFSRQNQRDEINPNYRRIIVRNYKLIYKIQKENILILRIFDTRQDPGRLKI